MRGTCNCSYECDARSIGDLAEMVAADGGHAEVDSKTTRIFCPDCSEELTVDTGGVIR